MPWKEPETCVRIRDRVDKWEKYWTINRSLYYEWIDFVMGDQWREDESKLFERYNKIPMMVNKLGVLMNHMLGDQIQNTPNLVILPDEDVPAQTAAVRSALIRNINLNSDAKSVYQNAYGQAIVGGYSAIRVGTEYIHDDSFDQEIRIYGFSDPNQCYWDISAKDPCKTDGMYCGFKVRVSRKKFRDMYGKDIESQIGTTATNEDSTMAFADDDSITIINDYEKEGRREKIYRLSDGAVVDAEGFRKLEKVNIDGKRWLIHNNEPVSKLEEREVVRYDVINRQVAGDFVLEKEDFPTITLLPILFVDQKSYYTKQGQQITRSFFKDAKDPQKYLNYLMTQSAYIMKIARYDQFLMPRKCAASPDAMQQWRDPSVVRGALYYDETTSGEKPEQLKPPELSASLSLEYQRTLGDIQSGTGLYNTQMGEMGNEVSGEAIRRRTQRGMKNTQIPRTSLDIAVATAGEVINEMIPKVYDTARNLVLPMPESEAQQVTINQPADPYGLQVDNDMTQGRYKIRLKPGPSYEGQKEDALESMNMVLQADRGGQVFPLIADLYVENLPLDNNIELRNRLRSALVPPEIIEAGKTGKPLPPKQNGPSPEQIEVQLKQAEMQQRAQQAQMDFQLKQQQLEQKQKEMQLKALESHQDMTMQWEKLQAEKEEAAAELQETMLRYQAEASRIGADLHINQTDNLMKLLMHREKMPHERDMQAREHAHQSRSVQKQVPE